MRRRFFLCLNSFTESLYTVLFFGSPKSNHNFSRLGYSSALAEFTAPFSVFVAVQCIGGMGLVAALGNDGRRCAAPGPAPRAGRLDARLPDDEGGQDLSWLLCCGLDAAERWHIEVRLVL